MSVRPPDVLDIQGALIEYMKNERFVAYHQAVMQSVIISRMAQKASEGPLDMMQYVEVGPGDDKYLTKMSTDPEVNRRVRNMVDNIAFGAQAAYAYHVAGDMIPLIEHAARLLDGTDKYTQDILPTRTGFVVFEKGLPLVDARGKKQLVSALLWMPGQFPDGSYGTIVHSWNDGTREPDEVYKNLEPHIKKTILTEVPEIQRFSYMGPITLPEGLRVGPETLTVSEEIAKMLEEQGKESDHLVTNMPRLLLAYWLLLDQTVIDVGSAAIPRAFQKRARRRNLPPRVVTVQLRRVERPNRERGESAIEYDHRWYVRGHWRWAKVSQHHPLAQETPEGYVARVWVRGHIKGPEDKPLYISDKVYSLQR